MNSPGTLIGKTDATAFNAVEVFDHHAKHIERIPNARVSLMHHCTTVLEQFADLFIYAREIEIPLAVSAAADAGKDIKQRLPSSLIEAIDASEGRMKVIYVSVAERPEVSDTVIKQAGGDVMIAMRASKTETKNWLDLNRLDFRNQQYGKRGHSRLGNFTFFPEVLDQYNFRPEALGFDLAEFGFALDVAYKGVLYANCTTAMIGECYVTHPMRHRLAIGFSDRTIRNTAFPNKRLVRFGKTARNHAMEGGFINVGKYVDYLIALRKYVIANDIDQRHYRCFDLDPRLRGDELEKLRDGIEKDLSLPSVLNTAALSNLAWQLSMTKLAIVVGKVWPMWASKIVPSPFNLIADRLDGIVIPAAFVEKIAALDAGVAMLVGHRRWSLRRFICDSLIDVGY
jgi:hypothetical protein